jgi:hypothetical protein
VAEMRNEKMNIATKAPKHKGTRNLVNLGDLVAEMINDEL